MRRGANQHPVGVLHQLGQAGQEICLVRGVHS